MDKRVFEDLKVVDFSWVVVGPLIAKSLADFGATVLHIESIARPDTLRTSLPFKGGIQDLDFNGYFPLYNSNKYGMALNLQHPKGLDVAKKFVAWSDIVIESFRPGVMRRLGLGYEDLRSIKPDLIMLSTTMQGQSGPHALQPGFGNQLVGLAGFPCVTGWPDRGAIQPYGAYTDCIAPYFGITALIGALLYRKRTGKGQHLDLSQYEAGVQFMSTALLDWVVNGRAAVRKGNSSPCASPHGAYRCLGEDRWCALAIFNDAEWEGMCLAMGKEELIRDPRFGTLSDRKKNEVELNRLVEEWTLKFDASEVMARLQAAGVPAGVVTNNSDLFEDPQLQERQCFWIIDHSVLGFYPHPSPSFKLSKTPAQPRMPAPCLGEHTEFICKEFLKMSDDEFKQLLCEDVLK
jgi:benzylsuccinate CoA-transferase BbsF subunit